MDDLLDRVRTQVERSTVPISPEELRRDASQARPRLRIAAAVVVLVGLAVGVVAMRSDPPRVRSGTPPTAVGQATLTVRRELPGGPIWEEGSTMVVRVFEGDDLVFEDEVGADGKQAVATTTLAAATYRVDVAQRPCVESCTSSARDPETAACHTEITVGSEAIEVTARVDRNGCELSTRLGTEQEPQGLDNPILEGTLPSVEARVEATGTFELVGTAEPGKLGARMAINSNPGWGGISTEPRTFDGLMIGGITAEPDDPTLAFWFGVTADEVVRIDITVGCSEVATTQTVATSEIPWVRFFAVAAPASATRTEADVSAGRPNHIEPTVRGYGADGTLLVESLPGYSGDVCQRPATSGR